MNQEIRDLTQKYNQAVENRNRIMCCDDRHTPDYVNARDHALRLEDKAAHDLAYAVARFMQSAATA